MPRIKAKDGSTGAVSQWAARLMKGGVFSKAEWAMDDPRALEVDVGPRFQWEQAKKGMPGDFEEVD